MLFLDDQAGADYRRGFLVDGSELLRPDWPAVGVSWEAARAYSEWFAQRTGFPWRLPTTREWEKAAQGVDDRLYPWGDFFDPSFCHTPTPARVPNSPVSVIAFPQDQSVYGVRGLVGNVRDWCADLVAQASEVGHSPLRGESPTSDFRSTRGGSFRQPPSVANTALDARLPSRQGFPDVGFRLVRSV